MCFPTECKTYIHVMYVNPSMTASFLFFDRQECLVGAATIMTACRLPRSFLFLIAKSARVPHRHYYDRLLPSKIFLPAHKTIASNFHKSQTVFATNKIIMFLKKALLIALLAATVAQSDSARVSRRRTDKEKKNLRRMKSSKGGGGGGGGGGGSGSSDGAQGRFGGGATGVPISNPGVWTPGQAIAGGLRTPPNLNNGQAAASPPVVTNKQVVTGTPYVVTRTPAVGTGNSPVNNNAPPVQPGNSNNAPPATGNPVQWRPIAPCNPNGKKQRCCRSQRECGSDECCSPWYGQCAPKFSDNRSNAACYGAPIDVDVVSRAGTP